MNGQTAEWVFEHFGMWGFLTVALFMFRRELAGMLHPSSDHVTEMLRALLDSFEKQQEEFHVNNGYFQQVVEQVKRLNDQQAQTNVHLAEIKGLLRK